MANMRVPKQARPGGVKERMADLSQQKTSLETENARCEAAKSTCAADATAKASCEAEKSTCEAAKLTLTTSLSDETSKNALKDKLVLCAAGKDIQGGCTEICDFSVFRAPSKPGEEGELAITAKPAFRNVDRVTDDGKSMIAEICGKSLAFLPMLHCDGKAEEHGVIVGSVPITTFPDSTDYHQDYCLSLTGVSNYDCLVLPVCK